MKLNNRMLALALASSVRSKPDERGPRLYLAQRLWNHITSARQQPAAVQLLELGDMPSEKWPHPLTDEQTAHAAFAQSLNDLAFSGGGRSRLQRMVALRRVAWWARIYAAAIEKDLHKAVVEIENSGVGETIFYPNVKAAPWEHRVHVRTTGPVRRPPPPQQQQQPLTTTENAQ